MQSFSDRLEWARRQAGYSTPQAAAEAFGWNVNTYKSHDNGMRASARGPKEEIVRRYARAFSVDWIWLMTGAGVPNAKGGLNGEAQGAHSESMSDRLREARKAAGFKSARSAAIKFGWGASTYAAHENGQNEFDPETAATYARAFKTTAAYLLTGEGAKSRKSVVSSYDPDAVEIASGGEEMPEETPRPLNFPPDAIKELASKAGMGSGQTIQTSYLRDGKEIVQQDAVLDDYWRIPPPFVRSVLGTKIADLLVVECEGDSMRPTLEPRERVIVDTAHKRLSPDGIYAIRNRYDETVVKRLALVEGENPKVLVISDNPAHPPQERRLDEVEIVGKVVMGLKLF